MSKKFSDILMVVCIVAIIAGSWFVMLHFEVKPAYSRDPAAFGVAP